MTIAEFLSVLNAHPDKLLRFVLPDGTVIPPHFHITEVGHASRRFVDCGGTLRNVESCVLQSWVANDDDHRLHAGKLVKIFGHADFLPNQDLPVELEYNEPVLSQYPVVTAEAGADAIHFQLERKHTDCLAKDKCLPGVCCPAPAAAAPTAKPRLNFSDPLRPAAAAATSDCGCAPGSCCG